jgi:hypothetical protein
MQEYSSPPIILDCAKLLRNPIPRAQEDIENHVIELNALQYPVVEAQCDMLQTLYEKKKQFLWPKDVPNMKMTELDRTTKLNADTAVLERDYQLLCKIEGLLISRLNICMKMLE